MTADQIRAAAGDAELSARADAIVYYWIRHEDLAAVRFDRSWAILQCF